MAQKGSQETAGIKGHGKQVVGQRKDIDGTEKTGRTAGKGSKGKQLVLRESRGRQLV